MRFSVAAFVALASLATAQSTVYETDVETIYSCAPTVTNCPYKTKTTPAAVSATSVVPVPTMVSVPASSIPMSVAPYPVSSAPAAQSTSVITVTTCVPTTILSTITMTPTSTSTPAPSAVMPTTTMAPPVGTGAVKPT